MLKFLFFLFVAAVAARDVTLDYTDVVDYTAFSYLGVRSGSVYDILWRPKEDVRIVEVKAEGFTFFDGKEGTSGVTKFHTILNFTAPVLASVTADGEDTFFHKKGGQWRKVEKDEYSAVLSDAKSARLSFLNPVTLDLATLDKDLFHVNTSKNDERVIHNITPFNGFYVTKVVDGETTIWEAQGTSFAYYVLFFGSLNGKLVRLHVVDNKRFAHKVLRFSNGKWNDTNINTYIDVIDTPKTASYVLDVTPGKDLEDYDDVSIAQGVAFNVDYTLFTTSMHHRFDEVVFGGKRLYTRSGNEEHCSHVAVHDGKDKKAVHIVVVSKTGAKHLFFLGDSELKPVEESEFPKEFMVAAE